MQDGCCWNMQSTCALKFGYESNSTVTVMDLHKLSHKDSVGEKAQHHGGNSSSKAAWRRKYLCAYV